MPVPFSSPGDPAVSPAAAAPAELAALLGAQNRALEVVAGQAPIAEAMGALAAMVGELCGGGCIAAIMLVEADKLRSCAGPGLPESYLAAVDGLTIRQGFGTCVDAAARACPVFTPDIEAAPSWRGIAHLPLALGFKGCWSMPIIGSDGAVLGTLGTYFREKREPTVRERLIVEGLAKSAALAIERRRSEGALRLAAEANAKFRAFFEQGAYFAGVMALDGTLTEANRLSLDASGFRREEVIGRKFWECGWWSPSPVLQEMIRGAVRQAASGSVFRTESEYFVANGSVREVALVIAPVKDQDGRVIFLTPTGVDITERAAPDTGGPGSGGMNPDPGPRRGT